MKSGVGESAVVASGEVGRGAGWSAMMVWETDLTDSGDDSHCLKDEFQLVLFQWFA